MGATPTTATTPTSVRRAASRDQIAPLLEMCNAGRLFEVQAWIAAGRPVNMPPPPPKKTRPRSPLQTARRSLLELAPDYAVEFVWIMRRYGACTEASVRELLRTGSIREHTRAHTARLRELLEGWPAV